MTYGQLKRKLEKHPEWENVEIFLYEEDDDGAGIVRLEIYNVDKKMDNDCPFLDQHLDLNDPVFMKTV